MIVHPRAGVFVWHRYSTTCTASVLTSSCSPWCVARMATS
jgi:hypothetical protein